MKLKKLLLSIGTLTTIVAPVAAVVSCGEPDSAAYSESDLLRISNLKSTEAHSKLQDLWLAKVLISEYKIKDQDPLTFLQTMPSTTSFKDDFKNTLTWVLKNKLFESKDALSSLYKEIRTNAPASIAGDNDANKDAIDSVKALNKKIFNRSDISKAVDDVMTDVTDVTKKSWIDVFYNYSKNKEGKTEYNPSILGVKDLVLKMLITKKYMDIDSAHFKETLPNEYVKLAAKYKDSSLIGMKEKLFPLIVSTINSGLAYKNTIELAANKSGQFIVGNIDNNVETGDVDKVFDVNSSPFKKGFTYTIEHQTVVDELLAKDIALTTTSADIIGFQGIASLPSGEDALDTSSADALKLTKDADARDGFIVDGKIVDKDIRFTDKEKTKVSISYYTSLMPTYDDTSKTLKFDSKTFDDEHIDILKNIAYSKDQTLYSEALKYFTERKTNPILIKVTNDWARNYYLDEGLQFIEKEDE